MSSFPELAASEWLEHESEWPEGDRWVASELATPFVDLAEHAAPDISEQLAFSSDGTGEDESLYLNETKDASAYGAELESYQGDADLDDPTDGHVDHELTDWLHAVGGLPQRIQQALLVDRGVGAVRLLLAAGVTDENRLTNLLFHARHPELNGRSIRADERRLASEWITIRDTVVRPQVRASNATAGSTTATPPAESTSSGPDVRLGTLQLDAPGRHPRSYHFTPDDLIWTAKLLVHEAGGHDDANNAAVLWAMFNRYILFLVGRPKFPTFSHFIRRYSTTLQPVLVSKGATARHQGKREFVPTGGYYIYKGKKILRGQLRRHLDIQKAPWTSVKASARSLATRALTGGVPNPGIGLASEFASTRIYYRQRHGAWPDREQWRRYTQDLAARKGWRWIGDVPGIDQKKNAFFVDKRVRNLPPSAVRIVPPSGSAASEMRVGAPEGNRSAEDELEVAVPWHEEDVDGVGDDLFGDREAVEPEELIHHAHIDADAARDERTSDEEQAYGFSMERELERFATLLGDLPGKVYSALRQGYANLAVRLMVAGGVRDEDRLSNMVFHARHPELGGRSIRRGEHSLAAEWLAIRDDIVRPIIHAAPEDRGPTTISPETRPASRPSPVNRPASLSSSRLRWPGHSPQEIAFMRAVYDRQAARSRGDFVVDLPDRVLADVEANHRARRDAAEAVVRLLAEARAALAREHPSVRIGITSAYRSASRQFAIWQGKDPEGTSPGSGFPYYYGHAIREGKVRAGDFSSAAVDRMARYIGGYIASPGYSNHQDGLAFDFGTAAGRGRLRKICKRAWFHAWLTNNAHRFGFEPLATEPWHWVYRPASAGQHLEEGVDLSGEVSAQEAELDEAAAC